MMDTVIQTLVIYGIEILCYIVLCLLGIFGSWLLQKMSKNKQLANITAATEQVIAAAGATVLELQQMFVQDWKAAQNGKLTEEQIAELRIKLVEITMAKLSAPTLKLLEAAKVDVITMISSVAEQQIYNMKAGA